MSDTPTPAGKGQWTLVTKPTDLDMPSAGIGHEQEKPGAEPESIRAGHEPDWFDARGVIFVPVLVAIAAAVTYGFVTLMFTYFTPGAPLAEGAHPQAAARNAREFNERVRDISSQNPHAPVRQPRLEWVRTIEKKHPDEPVYYRSFKTPETGNSPELRPEELRPEYFVDWNTGERPLIEYKWVSREKGVVRIPVSEAIRIVAGQKKLPARPGRLTEDPVREPQMSNGGQPGPPQGHRTGGAAPKADGKAGGGRPDEPVPDGNKK